MVRHDDVGHCARRLLLALVGLVMLTEALGVAYTENGYDCTPAAEADKECETECRKFKDAVNTFELSDSKVVEKKNMKKCKKAAKRMLEVFDAVKGPLPSANDINLPEALRPLTDDQLNAKIKTLFTDPEADDDDNTHCYVDLEARWRTRDAACTNSTVQAETIDAAVLRIADDLLPYYHKSKNGDTEVHSYCLVTMRKIMKDPSSSMFPLTKLQTANGAVTDGQCKMFHPLFKRYESGSCDESCWKATVDNMKTATGGADGKFRCCALLYYDKMTQYTYFNGKPQEGGGFDTLTIGDKEVKKGDKCEGVPCTTFPEAVSYCNSEPFAEGDYMLNDAEWGQHNCYTEKAH